MPPKPSTKSLTASTTEAASSTSEPAPAAVSASWTLASARPPSPSLQSRAKPHRRRRLCPPKSSESSEDSAEQAQPTSLAAGFTGQDALVGIAASATAPTVLGALQHANPLGALTIASTCVPKTPPWPPSPTSPSPLLTGPAVITAALASKPAPRPSSSSTCLSTGVMHQNRSRLRQPHGQRDNPPTPNSIDPAWNSAPSWPPPESTNQPPPLLEIRQRKNRHRHSKTQPLPPHRRSRKLASHKGTSPPFSTPEQNHSLIQHHCGETPHLLFALAFWLSSPGQGICFCS